LIIQGFQISSSECLSKSRETISKDECSVHKKNIYAMTPRCFVVCSKERENVQSYAHGPASEPKFFLYLLHAEIGIYHRVGLMHFFSDDPIAYLAVNVYISSSCIIYLY